MVYSKNNGLTPKVILFHTEGEAYLKKFILYDTNYSVFDPAKDVVYDFFKLPGVLFNAFYKNAAIIVKNTRLIRNVKNLVRKMRAQIISDQLRALKPKVVITFNDNSTTFHLVSEICDEILFLAIQNGGRHSWCATDALPDKDLKYHIDEYYCFGPYVERLFRKEGHNIKTYHHSGSLLGGYFFSTILSSKMKTKKKYDICLVSQWHKNVVDVDKLPKEWMKLGEAINVLTENIVHYASAHNKTVCIALRSNTVSEREFYYEQFNGNCVFQQHDRLAFSSYSAAADSNLIIALNSTLASETFGMGMKVLFVNPFDEQWLKPTDNSGIWYLSESDYDSFSARTGQLLNMSQDEYLANAGSEMKDVMSYKYNRPAHLVIRERILKVISNTG